MFFNNALHWPIFHAFLIRLGLSLKQSDHIKRSKVNELQMQSWLILTLYKNCMQQTWSTIDILVANKFWSWIRSLILLLFNLWTKGSVSWSDLSSEMNGKRKVKETQTTCTTAKEGYELDFFSASDWLLLPSCDFALRAFPPSPLCRHPLECCWRLGCNETKKQAGLWSEEVGILGTLKSVPSACIRPSCRRPILYSKSPQCYLGVTL